MAGTAGMRAGATATGRRTGAGATGGGKVGVAVMIGTAVALTWPKALATGVGAEGARRARVAAEEKVEAPACGKG